MEATDAQAGDFCGLRSSSSLISPPRLRKFCTPGMQHTVRPCCTMHGKGLPIVFLFFQGMPTCFRVENKGRDMGNGEQPFLGGSGFSLCVVRRVKLIMYNYFARESPCCGKLRSTQSPPDDHTPFSFQSLFWCKGTPQSFKSWCPFLFPQLQRTSKERNKNMEHIKRTKPTALPAFGTHARAAACRVPRRHGSRRRLPRRGLRGVGPRPGRRPGARGRPPVRRPKAARAELSAWNPARSVLKPVLKPVLSHCP